jgi:ribosomal protein S27AE
MSEEKKYFEKLEAEKRATLAKQLREQREAEALAARRQLHWHKCGKCGADMDTVLFRGVEIELCPDCGAVLLDQGELEQLAGKDQSGIFSGLKGLFKH